MTNLPCYPCPHNSNCCSWGASLTNEEAAMVLMFHGHDALVWDEEEQGFRTQVVDGKCVFITDNNCTIHSTVYYPLMCKGFPYLDQEGNPYLFDKTICPELKV